MITSFIEMLEFLNFGFVTTTIIKIGGISTFFLLGYFWVWGLLAHFAPWCILRLRVLAHFAPWDSFQFGDISTFFPFGVFFDLGILVNFELYQFFMCWIVLDIFLYELKCLKIRQARFWNISIPYALECFKYFLT